MEQDMIVLEDISKIYHIGENEVRALDHASLRIKKGEFVSIIGPSGSGKSTMMNIIGCLDTLDEGKYYLEGQLIEEYSENQLARIRNKKIGFIFQNFNLIGNLSAGENVELPLIYQKVGRNERKKRVEEALSRVKLSERADHKPTELSGGQQQRVAIARAIASKPSILLADEPTGNLDSSTGEEIMRLFHELHAQGNTIVLITHDEWVADQAQRKIRIKDGHAWEVEEENPDALSEPEPQMEVEEESPDALSEPEPQMEVKEENPDTKTESKPQMEVEEENPDTKKESQPQMEVEEENPDTLAESELPLEMDEEEVEP